MNTTSATKHTPGPWTLQAGRSFVTSSGEFYITYGKDKHDNPKFRNFCELDANARLIAAAPELLEALREATHSLEWAVIHNGMVEHAGRLQAAKAAIAKAEGRL